MANPNEYFDEGYRKYKGSLYRVCTLGSEIVVVAGPDKLTELLAAPDHVISSHAAANEVSALPISSSYQYLGES